MLGTAALESVPLPVILFSETSREAKRPFATTAFLNWKKIRVPAGEEVVLEVGEVSN